MTLLALLGCRADPDAPDARAPHGIAFALDDARFDGDPIDPDADLFTVVVADYELDGDPDVLINRHLFAPVELFLNDGDGNLTQLNRKGADRTGFYDNPGIPSLYADDVAADAPGVWVWHDVLRSGSWRFRVVVDAPRSVRLGLVSNTGFEGQDGLGAEELAVTSDSEWHLDVAVDGQRDLRVQTILTGSELTITPEGPDPLPIFVGPEAARFDGPVSLWKPDPHGIAWVDGLGSAEPDLFVCRGALIGSLAPPFDPKLDRLYEHVGGALQQSPFSHPSYDRGRQVMWLDVDEDGTNELYVADTTTPNQLLDPDQGFADRAPELGLDLVGPDVVAWVDLDRDGHLDQLHAEGTALGVALARGGRFEVQPGADWGLTWDAEPRTGSIFDQASYRLVDWDRDGDLDVVLIDVDSQRIWLFRADPGGLVDVTDEVGLGGADGFAEVLVFDVDDDGWMDLFAAGPRAVVWRNEGGTFRAVDLGLPGAATAAVADLDGDGRQDVVYATTTGRYVLFDRSTPDHAERQVWPDAPLGSVVTGRYLSGGRLAQSWGQATVSRYSQGQSPLWYGSPAEDPLVALSVQCPGCVEPGPEVAPGDALACAPCP